MDLENLEDKKAAFEVEESNWSPRKLHLAQLLCCTASQLERQRRKPLKWEKRAEEIEQHLDAYMEAVWSQQQLLNSVDYPESLIKSFVGQNCNLSKSPKSDGDGTKTENNKEGKTLRRKEEKEKNNKNERAAKQMSEKERQTKEREEEKKRKAHERNDKKERKEREEKEKNERKEREKKERKERAQKEKTVKQNECENKDEEKGEMEGPKKKEKKTVTFCERVTVYRFTQVTNPCQ